ncbi:MAG: YicC/YloC family endoribonuclease [Planctomycetota bacterium]|nr:YicC/YloC family endoribonuclease [Planctomycetota bacterium]
MVRSMTGYGDASTTAEGVHYFLEVRSLNNKYFKATIRLAEAFQGLEAEFESRLRERIARGTVTVSARCADASEQAAYEINTKALARYVEQLRGVTLDNAAFDIGALLTLPGVLQPPASEEDTLARARDAFLPLLDRACDRLMEMREREGRVLVADISAHLDFIADRLGVVSARAPGVIADYESRLRQRIDALIKEAGLSLQPADLIREIAVYAERTDIAEEIKRLSAHLDQFRDLLQGSNARPIGRTLDFLAQEMLREANTIASKSPDAAISKATVDIKGAIDRIKEQSQNLE